MYTGMVKEWRTSLVYIPAPSKEHLFLLSRLGGRKPCKEGVKLGRRAFFVLRGRFSFSAVAVWFNFRIQGVISRERGGNRREKGVNSRPPFVHDLGRAYF